MVWEMRYGLAVLCLLIVVVTEAKRWQSFGSGRFLGMSTLLLSSENANHGHSDKSPENLGKEKRPWKFLRFDEVKLSIESSDSIEEALNAAEEVSITCIFLFSLHCDNELGACLRADSCYSKIRRPCDEDHVSRC